MQHNHSIIKRRTKEIIEELSPIGLLRYEKKLQAEIDSKKAELEQVREKKAEFRMEVIKEAEAKHGLN